MPRFGIASEESYLSEETPSMTKSNAATCKNGSTALEHNNTFTTCQRSFLLDSLSPLTVGIDSTPSGRARRQGSVEQLERSKAIERLERLEQLAN